MEKNLQMVNWKGKYVPTKGSNIWEVFAGVSFYLANWMNLHVLKAYSQTGGSFSIFLSAAGWVTCKDSALLLSVVSLLPFQMEWLRWRIGGSYFQSGSVLFSLWLPVSSFQDVALMRKNWYLFDVFQMSLIFRISN